MNPRRNLQTRKNRRKRNEKWWNRHMLGIPKPCECHWIRADSEEWKAFVLETGMRMALQDLERMLSNG